MYVANGMTVLGNYYECILFMNNQSKGENALSNFPYYWDDNEFLEIHTSSRCDCISLWMFGSLPSWLLEYFPYGKWTSKQLRKIQRYARSTDSFYQQLTVTSLLFYSASFVLLSDYYSKHLFPSLYSILQLKRDI